MRRDRALDGEHELARIGSRRFTKLSNHVREHVALGVDVRQSLPAFVGVRVATPPTRDTPLETYREASRAHELLLQTKHLIAKSLLRRAKIVHRVALRLDADDELRGALSRLL